MKNIRRMKSFASSLGNGREPKIVLPDIKMRPKEMLNVSRLLSHCDPLAQIIFITLMESWSRSGFEAATTPQTIVLNAPCGEGTSPIAVLIEGDASNERPRPAAIVLCWDRLRKQKQFPRDALDAYQNTVRGIAPLHVTPSSAHIYLEKTFTLAQAKRLLKAMKKLAGCIRPELAEPLPAVKSVTPDNMRGTLKLCPPEVQAIFKELIAGWMGAGGLVQAKQTGRIYLRLKTKAHRSGTLARLSRNFNLLVLAAPKGKTPAHIEAAWNLSRSKYGGYLDCAPDSVENFERTAMALPGFVRKGTLSRIFLHTGFSLAHSQTLANAALALKAAEESAL
jgi:hypothetical protein